jgi:hypothetical protein
LDIVFYKNVPYACGIENPDNMGSLCPELKIYANTAIALN